MAVLSGSVEMGWLQAVSLNLSPPVYARICELKKFRYLQRSLRQIWVLASLDCNVLPAPMWRQHFIAAGCSGGSTLCTYFKSRLLESTVSSAILKSGEARGNGPQSIIQGALMGNYVAWRYCRDWVRNWGKDILGRRKVGGTEGINQ